MTNTFSEKLLAFLKKILTPAAETFQDKDTEKVDISEEIDNQEMEISIDGTLDLHTFKPKELKNLLPDYIENCKEKHIYDLRIVHGKGKGVLRKSVHSILSKRDDVDDFRIGGMGEGSWGATIVKLKREDK